MYTYTEIGIIWSVLELYWGFTEFMKVQEICWKFNVIIFRDQERWAKFWQCFQMFSNVLKHYTLLYIIHVVWMVFQKNKIILRISYHHLVQRSRPTSSEVQTCYFWGALLIFAHIVLNIFELCPIHICCPNTCAPPSSLVTVHLAKNWVGKQKFGSSAYISSRKHSKQGKGGRGAKTNLTGKETEIALISLLSPCWAVESAIPVFVQRALGFTQKAFQGCWMLGPVRQNWCIL